MNQAKVYWHGCMPSEHSSGGRQRLGAMSKQGNTLLAYLWCEAAMHAVERHPALKRFHRRKLVQKGPGKARVAAARKLGIRLWIMMRDQIDYQEFCRRGKARQESGGVHAGMPDINTSSWSGMIEEMSGGQHRVGEATRTEPVGWTGKQTENCRRSSRSKQQGCTSVGVCAKGTKKN